MEPLENSSILKAIGLDEKNKWILHEEKLQKFLKFISENLDSSNILTNLELESYENLKESRKVLDEQELEQELKDVEHSFPGFFSVTDEMLEELENETKNLEFDIIERSDRLSRMKDFEEEQLNKLIDIEKNNNDIELKQRLLIDQCLKRSKELASIQESNTQEIAQLNKIYTQQQSTPSIISQMPLDMYFNKCNQFLGLLEVCMNQNFNIAKANEDLFSEHEESQIRSIYQVKTEITEMEKKKYEEQMNVAGVNYVIENINEYKNKIGGDYFETRSVIDNLAMEKENLQTSLNVLILEGQLLVENVTEQKMVKLFHEFHKEKNEIANKQAQKVSQIYELTDTVVYVCELLWVALQLDLNSLKNRVDNSEEIKNQYQEYMKRMRQMKLISIDDNHSPFSQHFLNSFQKLLIDNLQLGKEELMSIDQCFKQYINNDEQINAMMNKLVEQEQLNKIQNCIKQIDEQSNILRDLIFCGPTNKPRLYDPKFIIPLHQKQQKRNEFDKMFHELKSNFQNKVFNPFTTDKFYRMKELLYIWFCSEPKKVVLAIKEAQNKAAEEGSTSYKALNITLNH